MKRILIPLILMLTLTGCSLFDGSYLSVTPHQEHKDETKNEVVSAANYAQLKAAVEEMIAQGNETGVIHVANFNQNLVEMNMEVVADYVRDTYPIGAYAVEDLTYEIGTNSGRPAVAVNITYRHSRIEIQRIRKMESMENAKQVIGEALESFDASLVLQIERFEELDVSQTVEDYAQNHPNTVMEAPVVVSQVYGSGKAKILELTFTYQTNREALRTMQSQVETVFDSAALYVSGEGSDHQKFSQLYGFLTERFDYKLETSITPAYSLLRHGVGDSWAFAAVYAAMCRQAGLECMIVTGTRMGEPWNWNIVQDDGRYYHVDILRSSAEGGFREYSDGEMVGYVWDYSAYPECDMPRVWPVTEAEPTETVPETSEDVSEETVPEENTENLE